MIISDSSLLRRFGPHGLLRRVVRDVKENQKYTLAGDVFCNRWRWLNHKYKHAAGDYSPSQISPRCEKTVPKMREHGVAP
ncbi:hypothetical protein [Desulfarculus baarsii]